ncbi:Splicing factor U2AF-associated protein 2 [Golovinomyces cichoracearum]|uniref:Splicing factor U2AF-associated protein 2 n=1 Tax=Golovinomyces cichoracearum TaxID=62708 RepID=A0A420IZQ6_9PEZI|nr:Splicing factor U2AF-associated protein 2 [Golovinomyces cichoracearum]
MDSEPVDSSFPTNPQDFESDDRISFSLVDKKYVLVQGDGNEFTFDEGIKRWVPVVDEALLEAQQMAYKVAGVDEDEPVDIMKRKRKKEYVNGEDCDGRPSKAPKTKKNPPAPRPNTAIYVTGLPSDTTVEEVHALFSRKCGVIAEEIDSKRPRIKLYMDEEGKFKGDALIVFFKAPSVDMAIMLLDDTEFRIGDSSSGKIKVQAADSSYKKVQQNNPDSEKIKGKNSNSGNIKEKQRIIKKTQKLDARLADWSDDEGSTFTDVSSKWNKVVILKHMFTLQELAEDPAAMLDIKEDIREECSKLGEVTNVILYDLEEDGVTSVRFSTAEAASACVGLMDKRSFAGQQVVAYLSDGNEHYRKSKKNSHEEE